MVRRTKEAPAQKGTATEVVWTLPKGYDRPTDDTELMVPILVACKDCSAVIFNNKDNIHRHNEWHAILELAVKLSVGALHKDKTRSHER